MSVKMKVKCPHCKSVITLQASSMNAVNAQNDPPLQVCNKCGVAFYIHNADIIEMEQRERREPGKVAQCIFGLGATLVVFFPLVMLGLSELNVPDGWQLFISLITLGCTYALAGNPADKNRPAYAFLIACIGAITAFINARNPPDSMAGYLLLCFMFIQLAMFTLFSFSNNRNE